MNDTIQLFNLIEKNYLKSNFKQVILLWESRTNKIELNLNNKNELQVCDALCLAYFNEKKFDECIIYVKLGIKYIDEKKEKIEFYQKTLAFYFYCLIEVYREKKWIFKEYKAINKYIKLGGQDIELIKSKKIIEELLYGKYLFKINNFIFPISYIALIVLYRLDFLFFLPLIIYFPIIIVGFVWMFIVFFYKKLAVKLSFLVVLNLTRT